MDINSIKSALSFSGFGRIKSDNSKKDRDTYSGGYQQQGDQEQEEPKQEHFDQALEQLKNSKSVSASNLDVELVNTAKGQFLVVKGPDGRELRRITGPEIITIATSGHILDRRI